MYFHPVIMHSMKHIRPESRTHIIEEETAEFLPREKQAINITLFGIDNQSGNA